MARDDLAFVGVDDSLFDTSTGTMFIVSAHVGQGKRVDAGFRTMKVLSNGLPWTWGWLRSQTYPNHSIRFSILREKTHTLSDSSDPNAGALALNFQQASGRHALPVILDFCPDTFAFAGDSY